MKSSRFIICFVLMLAIQLVLARYAQTPHMYICMLPAMIMCLPMALPTWLCCVIAFACGMSVDFLADGMLGLNAAALLPVALCNKYFVGTFINSDIVERNYSFSFWQNGLGKIGGTLLLHVLIYSVIYTLLDTLDSRDITFILIKMLCSILASTVFGLVVINILCPRPVR